MPLPAGLAARDLRSIYYFLRLTRELDERLAKLYRQGKVVGGLHRCLGQEGESVATAYALQPQDVLSPLVRNTGSILVKGAKPVEILRQYMAKGTSPTGGRDQNIHFQDLHAGYLGHISHLGDMVPVMAGVTLSFTLRGERRVGMVYVGDGASSTGAFHEGIGLAAARRLPLVVILENNGYAYSTPTGRQTAVKRLADKRFAYGVQGESVDGSDVLEVYRVTREAVERARSGGGTALVEVVTYRLAGHAEHDDQRYQPAEEIAEWKKRDAVERFAATVMERGWLPAAELQAAEREARKEITRAVEQCEDEPLPEPTAALSAVYLDPPRWPPLWYRRRDG
ncbi:MAG: thiamine pyrophosphate-dependent dehydrogenase E1 component subunit alpha [Armatimonadota bacterium]